MEKKEVAALLTDIHTIYQNRFYQPDPMRALNVWYPILENCRTEKVRENFNKYALDNKFPPTAADLADGALIYKKPEVFKRDLEDGEGFSI